MEDTSDPGNKELVIDEAGSNELDFDRLEAIGKDRTTSTRNTGRRAAASVEGDKKHDAMQNMASQRPSLQDYLNDQMAIAAGPDAAARKADPLSHCPYRRQRLPARTVSLTDLAANFHQPPVSVAELEKRCCCYKSCSTRPASAPRDLRECLLLQLRPEGCHREIVRELILHHLGVFQFNQLPVISSGRGK